MATSTITVHAANPIEPDSWLNADEYKRFRKAYSYASCQSRAIPGLAAISPEDAYFIHSALARGEDHYQRALDEGRDV